MLAHEIIIGCFLSILSKIFAFNNHSMAVRRALRCILAIFNNVEVVSVRNVRVRLRWNFAFDFLLLTTEGAFAFLSLTFRWVVFNDETYAVGNRIREDSVKFEYVDVDPLVCFKIVELVIIQGVAVGVSVLSSLAERHMVVSREWPKVFVVVD